MRVTKIKWKQKLMEISLVFIPFILSGCWSAEEIHDIAIINAMGIDLNEAGEFEVTTVVVKPPAVFSQTFVGGTGGSQESKYLIETATGKTILEAMGKLSKSISEKMYLGQVDVVVVGEQAAREKMQPSLDFFTRENEFRPNIQLLVAKGKALDVLDNSPEFNITFGLEVMDIKNSNRYSATKMVKDISQFMKAFSSNTSDPITGVVTTAGNLGINVKEEEQVSAHNEQGNTSSMATQYATEGSQQAKPQITSLNGTAVFKNGNLKGFLDDTETRGLLWILGELKNEIVVLKCGNNNSGDVSVVIRDTMSQFIPLISGKGTTMTVDMNVEADLGEVTCSSLNIDSSQIDRLNQQLEEKIVKEATVVLNMVQKEWQSDIFGFGEVIYRKQPNDWDQMAPNWRNGGLKNMNVDLKVHANISRYGLSKDPSKADESR